MTLTYLTPGLGWAGRLCRLVRRKRRADGRPGLDHPDQQQRHALSSTPIPCSSPARSARPTRASAIAAGRAAAPGQLRQAGTESAGRERLGDFYLYPLPERTTIANRQTKQVSFLDVARHAGRARLRIPQWLARHARTEPQSADHACFASRPRATRGWATRCRPAPSGSISATPAATRSSSARARSATPPMGSRARPRHRPGLRRQGSADARRPREHITEPSGGRPSASGSCDSTGRGLTGEQDSATRAPIYWQTRMRYTLTNARPVAGHRPPLPVAASTMIGTTRGSSSESLQSERLSSDQVVWRVTGARQRRRRCSTPPSRPGIERDARAGVLAWPPAPPCSPAAAARRRRSSPRPARIGSRSPSIAIPIATPRRRSTSSWLNGYALISETRQISIPAGEIDDPLRRRRRRHPAAERDRHRLPGRHRRAQPRRLSALALDPARSLARPAGPRSAAPRLPPARCARSEAVIRSGADGAVVLQTAGRLRGAALHRPARDPGLSRAFPPASRRGRPCRCGPARSQAVDRDRHPVLSRQRLRLAGQLCRRALARRPPGRPVRLADPGEHRRDQLPRCRHPGGGRAPQPREHAASSRARAARSICAAGRRAEPATSRATIVRDQAFDRADGCHGATNIIVTGTRIAHRGPGVESAGPDAVQEDLGDLKLYRIPSR